MIKEDFNKFVRVTSKKKFLKNEKKWKANVWSLHLDQDWQNLKKCVLAPFFITTRCTKESSSGWLDSVLKEQSKVQKKTEINVRNLKLGQK